MTDARLTQARDLIHDEDFEAALEALDGAEGPEADLLRAEALIGQEEYEDAAELLETLADLDAPGEDAAPFALLGLCHYYLDELDEAHEALNAALRIDRNHITALHARALVLRDKEFHRASALDIDKALAILEGDAERSDLLADTYNLRASFALDDKDLDIAAHNLHLAVQADPDNTEYALDHARLLAVLSRTDEALHAADAILQRDDLCIEAWLLKSQLLYLQGKLDDAIANTRAALNADAEEPFIHLQLASFLAYQSRWEEALQTADAAIALDDDIVDGHQIRALALENLDRADEIDEETEDLRGETPDLPAFIYGDRVDPYEMASGALEQAAQMDPEQLKAAVEQLFASGQLPEALRPMIEMTLQNLPALLDQFPQLAAGGNPQQLLAQLSGGGAPVLDGEDVE